MKSAHERGLAGAADGVEGDDVRAGAVPGVEEPSHFGLRGRIARARRSAAGARCRCPPARCCGCGKCHRVAFRRKAPAAGFPAAVVTMAQRQPVVDVERHLRLAGLDIDGHELFLAARIFGLGRHVVRRNRVARPEHKPRAWLARCRHGSRIRNCRRARAASCRARPSAPPSLTAPPALRRAPHPCWNMR